jgi:hypothetical protein
MISSDRDDENWEVGKFGRLRRPESFEVWKVKQFERLGRSEILEG